MDTVSEPDFSDQIDPASFFFEEIKSGQREAFHWSKAGQTCPRCHLGTMDYNGLLVLRCKTCGYSGDSGCFT